MYAFKHTGPYAEWPIEAPISRNFDCEVIAPRVGVDGRKYDFDARLKLTANTHALRSGRECVVSIILPDPSNGRATNAERWAPVRVIAEQLERRGLWWAGSGPRYGTWRRYLLEVEKMHAALEILGWELTAEEQAIVDAVDAYGRQAPAWVLERLAAA